MGSYCCKYDWKASSSQSTESLEVHTKVIICQSDGAHSRILSQQVASLENCWEKGAAAVDIIALEESAGEGSFHVPARNTGSSGGIHREEGGSERPGTALKSKEMRSWFHLLGNGKLFGLCPSPTSLPHDVVPL